MPVPPAELTAEFTMETSPEGEKSPQETGPESTALAGSRAEVLKALPKVIEAALDAGARGVKVRIEVPTEARQEA